MSWFDLLAIAVALAMDAFAVAIVAGLNLKVLTKRRVFRLSFHFGLFQAGMLDRGMVYRECSVRPGSGGCPLGCLCLAGAGGRKRRLGKPFPGTAEARTELDPT